MRPDGVPEKSDYMEALKTVKVEDFKDVGKIPCARNSLLYGIGAAFGLGAIRFILKRSIPSAANWSVGAFCGVSIVSFEVCQMDRKQKLERLQLIIKETDSSPKQQKLKQEAINKSIQVVIDDEVLRNNSNDNDTSKQ